MHLLRKKSWIVVGLLCSLFFNGWAQQSLPFTVSGIIYNMPSQKVYLMKYEARVTKIDSAQVDSVHNTFVLRGNDHEESHYKVWFSKSNHSIDLALKGKDIVNIIDTYDINADYLKNKRQLYIEGSSATSELLRYDTIYMHHLYKIAALRNAMDSLKATEHHEQKIKEVQKQILDVHTQIFDLGTLHIRKLISPVNVFIALITCDIQSTDYPAINRHVQMEELATFAKNAYPTSTPIKIFIDGYEKSKTTATVAKAKLLALVGQKRQAVLLPDTSGKVISSSIPKKYVLIDFWASWCKPCRQENPYLLQAYQQFKNKNFTIYSVSIDENKAQWLAAIRKDKTGLWTHVVDTTALKSSYIKEYEFTGIPANYLIDPEGKIIAVNLRGKELIETLKQKIP